MTGIRAFGNDTTTLMGQPRFVQIRLTFGYISR